MKQSVVLLGAATVALGLLAFAGAASAQSLPADIKQAGEIRIGSQANFPPVEFYKEGTKDIEGFSRDLLMEVAKRLGVKARYVEGEYTGLIPGIQAGRWDMSSGGMTDQPEREKVVDFVNYFASGGSILMRAGDSKGRKTIDEMCGTNAAVLQGSAPFIAAAEKASEKCVAAGKPAINLLKLTSSPDAKQQLDIARADAYLTDYVSASYLMRLQPGKYGIVGGDYTFTTWYFSWAFPKTGTQLRDTVQATLQGMLNDGTYAAILKNWSVEGGALKKITVNIATQQ
ncbi:MAG: ABC transporter substrate-binding protein [Alphaproteobacteria bacterium]